jgi:hypothetical protein
MMKNRMEELNALNDKRVMVYRNLRYKDQVVWSGKSTKLGLVMFHSDYVLIDSPKFKVSKAGQERVRREQKKYVHAGVVGTLADGDDWMIRMDSLVRVTYNPYKNDTFVRCDNGEPITEARLAIIDMSGVRVLL